MKLEEEIKQQKFRSGHQKALLNLLYTASWVQGKQQNFFKPFKITAQQFNILRILKGQHPAAISATEIKARMLDKNSDVSRLLDRLVAKDLISKTTCPNDKRATDVTITTSGMELLKTLENYQGQIDGVLSLSEEEAFHLSELLDKCRG
jgi:DNA-binding MarR family transcriptional regulator